jgi:AraC-like DNA-binding protein
VASPLAADGAMVERHALVWRRRRGLWVSAFWGSPDEDDVRRATEAYSLVLGETGRFRAFVDLSRLEHLNPKAFEILANWARESRAALDGRLEWQAFVIPPGVLGAVVCGFHKSLGYQQESRFFESMDEAVATLFRGDEAEEIRRRVLPRLDILCDQDLLRRFRRAVRTQPRADIASIARALTLSRRSLQRQLTQHGTTFSRERLAERMALAKERLQDPDSKVETIANELGFRSRQQFSQQFTRVVGVSPSEFRAR